MLIYFIDYQKAFDNVGHDLLIGRLREIGINDKDVRIIKRLYWGQYAEIRIKRDFLTQEFNIAKEVRQGCVLSRKFFNIYVEKIFQIGLEGVDNGIKMNGKPINNIRYADDTAILANNLEHLQDTLDRVTDGEQFGLSINTVTKINGQTIERVSKFKYLNEKWDCDEEVKIRIETAKTTYLKMKNILFQRTQRAGLPSTAINQVLCVAHLVVRSRNMATQGQNNEMNKHSKCGHYEECFESPGQSTQQTTMSC